MELLDKIMAAYEALGKNDLNKTARLVSEAEAELSHSISPAPHTQKSRMRLFRST